MVAEYRGDCSGGYTHFWCHEHEVCVRVTGRFTLRIVGKTICIHFWLLSKRCNPLVGGLQPPYLGQTCSFTIETGKYIQVVHNGADHWLVVTNIGVPRDGVVPVYDSLHKCLITSTELQIGAFQNYVIQINCHGNVSGKLRRHFDWGHLW